MITPNKVITLDESILSKLHVVLAEGPESIDVGRLYLRTQKHFETADQFIMTLDALYVLDRIDVDFKTRKVIYVS